MSAISETYDHAHNILEIVHYFPNVSLITSETEPDYY